MRDARELRNRMQKQLSNTFFFFFRSGLHQEHSKPLPCHILMRITSSRNSFRNKRGPHGRHTTKFKTHRSQSDGALLYEVFSVLDAAAVLLLWPVQRRPNWLADEQPHRLDVVLCIHREAVINSFWQDDQVPFLTVDTNPAILSVANIEISRAFHDVANLLVTMHVLLVERGELLLVIWERVGCDANHVFVVVSASGANRLQIGVIFRARERPVQHAKRSELLRGDAAPLKVAVAYVRLAPVDVLRAIHVPRAHVRACRHPTHNLAAHPLPPTRSLPPLCPASSLFTTCCHANRPAAQCLKYRTLAHT
mmetsp:Transcript_12965/g.34934  ORF Transcript_12965/g.34934 Transcript_12965/m.34934 type:complete len:308 (-) Transcript_12965:328-1251(-)